jgi:hypothetical protein
MNFCKRSAIWVCLTLAVAASPVQAQLDRGPDPEARAAGRAEAKGLVIQYLQERSVRAVEPAIVEREAAGIVKDLTEEQVEALLAGEEVAAVLSPKTAQAETAQTAEDAGPRLAVAAAPVVGDAKSDLLFVPVTPCRVIDTRLGGGKFLANEVRDYRIAGTAGFPAQGGKEGGCGIPLGATSPLASAVMVNLFAVTPEGSGDFRIWEFGTAMPLAAAITYDNLGPFFSIANGLIIPITGVGTLAKDMSVKAEFNRTHFAADVTGYFTRFPVENFQGGLKSELITNDHTTLTDMNDGACHELNSCDVTTAVPGTVVVEAWGQFVVAHAAGTLDRVVIGVETVSPVTCGYDADSANASDFEVSAALGANPDVDFTVSHGRAFAQPGGTTRTYYLSGKMLNGANTGDKIENSRLICTFIPD